VRRYLIRFTGSAYAGDAGKMSLGGYYPPGVTIANDTWYDVILMVRRSASSPVDNRVFLRARGSNTRTDLTGMLDRGSVVTSAIAYNLAAFGTVTGNGMDVTVDHVGWYSGAEWETVTDGDTSFAVNRRYWSVRGWENGTLTEFDIAASLSAPSAPSAPTANEISDTAIGSEWAVVAGAAAYLIETVNTGTSAVVDSQWVTGMTVAATGGLSSGTYRHDVYAASDDGVRSISAGASNAVTLPATAPSVAVTISDSTIASVETAAASAVLAGGATATLDGDAWDGSATTIVTAKAGDLIGPTAANPVIANDVSRAQTIIGYQGSAMRIILPSTRPSTWTLQRSSDGLTGWATDASQGSPTVNDSGLTYSGAVVGTDYATNHGWTLNASYYYAVLPTYSDGSIGQRSNVIRPTAAADYECSVSGTMPLLADGTCEWSGDTGTVVLSEAVTIGGRLYLTTGYSFTIASNGTWSVSLPRLAAAGAAQADGGSGAATAQFRFPDGSRVTKTIPDSSSAAFSALAAG
jgi:hypothetical protein